MTKVRLLTWAVIALVALNVALVIGLVVGKPGHPPRRGHGGEAKRPKNVIIDKLGFDEGQVGQYEALIESHQDKVFALDDEIAAVKEELYVTLNNEGQAGSEALLVEISNKLSEIERIHFHHFIDIRALCREDQLGKFKDLTSELSGLFKAMLSRPRRDRK